jgi:hypothetical protein
MAVLLLQLPASVVAAAAVAVAAVVIVDSFEYRVHPKVADVMARAVTAASCFGAGVHPMQQRRIRAERVEGMQHACWPPAGA